MQIPSRGGTFFRHNEILEFSLYFLAPLGKDSDHFRYDLAALLYQNPIAFLSQSPRFQIPQRRIEFGAPAVGMKLTP